MQDFWVDVVVINISILVLPKFNQHGWWLWYWLFPRLQGFWENVRQFPAGAAGEFSSPGSTLCADSYSVSIPHLY